MGWQDDATPLSGGEVDGKTAAIPSQPTKGWQSQATPLRVSPVEQAPAVKPAKKPISAYTLTRSPQLLSLAKSRDPKRFAQAKKLLDEVDAVAGKGNETFAIPGRSLPTQADYDAAIKKQEDAANILNEIIPHNAGRRYINHYEAKRLGLIKELPHGILDQNSPHENPRMREGARKLGWKIASEVGRNYDLDPETGEFVAAKEEQENVRKSLGDQEVGGIRQGLQSAAGPLARAAEAVGLEREGTADAGVRLGNAMEDEAARRDRGSAVGKVVRGVARSTTQMGVAALAAATTGGGSAVVAPATIASFGVSTYNEEYTNGIDRGLTPTEATDHAVKQGLIEGGVTAAMQLVGLGGLEGALAKKQFRELFRNSLGKSLKNLSAEQFEELTVTALQEFQARSAGLKANDLPTALIDTFVQTGATMGLFEAPSRARSGARVLAGLGADDVHGRAAKARAWIASNSEPGGAAEVIASLVDAGQPITRQMMVEAGLKAGTAEQRQRFGMLVRRSLITNQPPQQEAVAEPEAPPMEFYSQPNQDATPVAQEEAPVEPEVRDARRDFARYSASKSYVDERRRGLRDADVEYQRLKALADAEGRSESAKTAARTKVANKTERDDASLDIAVGHVSRDNVKYAPLDQVHPALAGKIVSEARRLATDTDSPATKAALEAIIAGKDRDAGAEVEKQKDRIVGILTGERDQRTGPERQREAPRPADPVVTLLLEPQEERASDVRRAIKSVVGGDPNDLGNHAYRAAAEKKNEGRSLDDEWLEPSMEDVVAELRSLSDTVDAKEDETPGHLRDDVEDAGDAGFEFGANRPIAGIGSTAVPIGDIGLPKPLPTEGGAAKPKKVFGRVKQAPIEKVLAEINDIISDGVATLTVTGDGKAVMIERKDGKRFMLALTAPIRLSPEMRANYEKSKGRAMSDAEYENEVARGTFHLAVDEDGEPHPLVGHALIRLSQGYAVPTTAVHELMHLARALGLFTDAEWNALKRKHARGAKTELDAEEAIARAFEKWHTTSAAWKKLVRLAEKIMAILKPGLTASVVKDRFAKGEVFGRTGVAKLDQTEMSQRWSGPAFSAGQIETPAFRKWFGDSKVTNADGTPMRLYHATPGNFKTFKPGGKNPWRSGRAIWLSPNAEHQPAAHNTGLRFIGGETRVNEGVSIMPLYAKIELPLVVDESTREWAQELFGRNFPYIIEPQVLDQLKAEGYDGVMLHEPKIMGNGGKLSEVIVFQPTQVKSAIANKGKFNPKNANVLFSAGGQKDSTITKEMFDQFVSEFGQIPVETMTTRNGIKVSLRSSPFKPALDSIRETLGPQATVETVLDLVTAEAGQDVGIMPDGSKSLSVIVRGKGVALARTISPDSIYNSSAEFTVEHRMTGNGAAMVQAQVRAARKQGMKKIEMWAAGMGKSYGESGKSANNGFYTWVRLGFDSPIAKISTFARAGIEEKFPEAKYLSDLMKTEAGREFWRENGASVSLTFDLADGSRSMTTLNEYVDAKAKAMKNTLGLKSPWFRRWFGASKIVNPDGSPKKMFHGTVHTFSAFDLGKADPKASFGPGIYATESADVAGGETGYVTKGLDQAGDAASPNVLPLYMSIKKPLDIDAEFPNWDKEIDRLYDSFPDVDFDYSKEKLGQYENEVGNATGSEFYQALSRASTEDGKRAGKARANGMLKALGYDGIVHTGGLSNRYGSGKPHGVAIAFESTQVKSAIGNTGSYDPDNPSMLFSAAEYYTGLPAFKRWFGNSKVVDADGRPKVVAHGARRSDRIVESKKFDPRRATSGPMPFFTDDVEIASRYSLDKQDTSMGDTPMFNEWFKLKVPGARKPVSIDRAWWSLSADQRSEIASLAPRVGMDEETGSQIVLHGADHASGLGGYDWHIKEARGNHLKALVVEWLESGSIFNEEGEFLKVLHLVGLDGATFHDPDAQHPGVFPVYLAIQNPLNTLAMPKDVRAALEQVGKRKRGKAGSGVDAWDKKHISGRAWLDRLKQDEDEGTSHAWTTIPDWVTETIKSFGYDGIQDVGGKNGGDKHTVWIPFRPNQIKSAIANRGTFDPAKDNPLFSAQVDDDMRPLWRDNIVDALKSWQRKGTPAQLTAHLAKTKGANDEAKWIGLDDFLAGKSSVTKEEVEAFVKANTVDVQEVVHSESDRVKNLRDAIDRGIGDTDEDGLDAKEYPKWNRDAKKMIRNGERALELLDEGDFEGAAKLVRLNRMIEIEYGDDPAWRKANRIADGEFNESLKYSAYQVPGGSNYTELLLTLPEKESPDKGIKGWGDVNGGTYDPVNYRSSHFDAPNVLAHVRFNERNDVDGNRLLFLEEVQSDWAQSIRKHGVDPAKGRPDTPFKTTWPMLAIKRMIRYASENGFDRIGWTSGEMQAERYDLSRTVKDLELRGRGDDLRLTATDHADRPIISDQATTREGLADLIGKEVAEKLLSQAEPDESNPYAARRMFGADLKIGGSGMKGFYDEILPAAVNKFVKKWGVKVGTAKLDGDVAVHSLQLTPEMLADAAGGMPLFASSSDSNVYQRPTFGKTGSLVRWLLTSAGDLPKTAFALKENMQSFLSTHERQVQFVLRDLRKAVTQTYGKMPEINSNDWNAIDNALRGGDIKLLPQALRAPVWAMRSHVDNLSKMLIESGALTDKLEATIDANMGVYLTRTYAVYRDPKHYQKVPAEIRNRAEVWMRQQLEQENGRLLPPTDNEVQQRIGMLLYADKAAEGPMALISQGKLGSKLLDTLKARKEIPLELRELWGEEKNPMVNYATSIAKVSKLLATENFLREARTAGFGKWLFEPNDPNIDPKAVVPIAGEGSAGMAPLNGLMTYPEVKKAFEDEYKSYDMNPILKLLLKPLVVGNAAVKVSKTVLSVGTQLVNLASNVGFMIGNGHFSPPALGQAFRALVPSLEGVTVPFTDIGLHSLVKAFGADYEAWRAFHLKLVANGVVGEDIAANELRKMFSDADLEHLGRWANNRVVRMAKAGYDAAASIYQGSDSIFKVIAWANERARYSRAFPEWSADQLDKHAADIVRNTLPTYAKIPKGIQTLRNVPVGNFFSWSAEVVRVTLKTLELALQEVKDPKTRSIGATRLVGILAAATIPELAVAFFRFKNGVTPDDEDDLRKLVPEWSKNSDLAWHGREENGDRTYTDLSRFNPYGYIRKTINAVMNGETAVDGFVDAAREASDPFTAEQLFGERVADVTMRGGATGDGRKVYNPEDTSADKAWKIFKHLGEPFVPGTLTSANRIYKAVDGENGIIADKGKVYDKATETWAFFGVRTSKISLSQSADFKAGDHARAMSNSNRIFNDVSQNAGTISKVQLAAAYESSDNARRRNFEEMHRYVWSLMRLGMSEKEVVEILRAKEISKENVAALVQGKYEPYMPGPEALASMAGKPDGEERVIEVYRLWIANSADPVTAEESVAKDLDKRLSAAYAEVRRSNDVATLRSRLKVKPGETPQHRAERLEGHQTTLQKAKRTIEAIERLKKEPLRGEMGKP